MLLDLSCRDFLWDTRSLDIQTAPSHVEHVTAVKNRYRLWYFVIAFRLVLRVSPVWAQTVTAGGAPTIKVHDFVPAL